MLNSPVRLTILKRVEKLSRRQTGKADDRPERTHGNRMAAVNGNWNDGGVSGSPHHAVAARFSNYFEPERLQRADYFFAIDRGVV